MTLDQLGSLRTAIARGRSVAGPEPVYFASGMSSVGRLRASLEIGQPVGITISNCPARCWEWVMANLADPRLRIFVDSGAYAEYTSEQEVSPAEWHRRYEKMARLAETVKSPRASIVLPDRVRDPAASLQRLADLAPYVRRIIGSGAEALLPLQKGRYTDPLVYLRDAARVIGVPVRTLVPSVPVVSRAYTTSQILDLVRRLQPARLHLLGITRSEAAKDLLPQIQALAPEALLSYDSVLAREGAGIISSVGGRWGGGPRGQTRARYQALSDIDPAAVVRTQEGGAPRRASHGVGRGKGGLDVLIRVLAQGKRGNPLDAAAARLTDLVGEEFELNRRARTAVKNQASLWLSGLYPDEWYEPGGIPPQQAMKVAGGGVLNWDYFVDKAQELLVREGISSTGRRSGTLAEAATQRAWSVMFRVDPSPQTAEDIAVTQDIRTPRGLGDAPWTFETVAGAIRSTVLSCHPTLTPFGADQLLRAFLRGGLQFHRRWVPSLRRGGITLEQLAPAICAYGQAVADEHRGWEWTSPRFESELADYPHPANDARWLAEQR